jgi:hypothetical protein
MDETSFKTFLNLMGYYPTSEYIQILLKTLDTDLDGRVSWNEIAKTAGQDPEFWALNSYLWTYKNIYDPSQRIQQGFYQLYNSSWVF